MQELVQTLLTTWPWQLRVAIGHALPLFISIWCLWSLRGHWKEKAAIPFLFALGAGFELARMLFTGTARTLADGRVQASVQGNFVPMLWMAVLAVMVAIACNKRIKWQAVWVCMFFPLYAIDLILGAQMFDGHGPTMLTAIGGAGPVDALLLGPLFAVLISEVSRIEVLAWPWMQKMYWQLRVRLASI